MPVPVKRPTSRDVARLAGVSQTTVSLIINDVPTAITAETRARVLEAIASLDYHPHEAARSLSRKATHTVGVAIPDAANPHYIEIAEGIEAVAQGRGYDTIVIITNFDAARERRCLQWLKQQRVDALIVCSTSDAALEEEVRAVSAQGYVASLFGRDVSLEWRDGERQLIEHLASLGHRRLGYIYGVADDPMLSVRLRNCLALQRQYNLPVVDRWVRHCGPGVDEGFRATQALVDECGPDDLPTALIVVNDLLAMGVLAALHAARIAVPNDISVAAFDNTYIARYAVPPLTSVDLEVRHMGEAIAHATLDRLASPESTPAHQGIPSHLVVRASTAMPKCR